MSSRGPTEPASTRSDALALVREVTAAVASTHDVDEVLQLIARLSAQALDVWECDIYEYVPRDAQAASPPRPGRSSPTPFDEEWLGDTVDVDELMDYRHRHRDAMPGRTARRRPRRRSWHPGDYGATGARRAGCSCRLCSAASRSVCSSSSKNASGTTSATTRRRSRRRSRCSAAIAIHNARQNRRMAEQNRHLTSLVDSSRAISSTVDLDEVLHAGRARGL